MQERERGYLAIGMLASVTASLDAPQEMVIEL